MQQKHGLRSTFKGAWCMSHTFFMQQWGSVIQRRILVRLPHEFEGFNAPEVGVRTLLECFRAERAAECDHPLAVFDSREPFAAGNGLLADGALDVCTFKVAGIKI